MDGVATHVLLTRVDDREAVIDEWVDGRILRQLDLSEHATTLPDYSPTT